MPPVSQGMVVQVPVSLSGHTLSALSLLISVPSLIASARCRSRDGLSLGTTFMPSSSSSASSASPNPTMFKSRRRFLKLFGNACTTCGARRCLGAECQRVCEDPQCSSPWANSLCLLFIYYFILLYYYNFLGLGGGAVRCCNCNVFWVWGDLVDRMASYSVLDHVDFFLLDVQGFRHVMLDNSYSQALCNLKQSEPHSLYPCFPDLQSARRIRFERERGVALGGGHLGRV